MRTTALLLGSAIAVLLVTQSFSAPCDGDTIEASKSSKSSNIKSASADAASKEVNAKNANGDTYNAKSSSSSTKSASASSSESVETYKAYKGGAPACDDSLPPRKAGESDVDYYKRIFPVNECDKASVKAFYVKVFKQYKGESDSFYVKRIDIIFTKVYKSLDIRFNDQYLCFLEKYYTIKYAKKASETDEEYFKRVITKTTETEEEYNDKIAILKQYIKNVDWSKVQVDYQSKTGYILVKKTSTSTGKSIDSGSSGCTKSLTSEEEIKKEYARKDTEKDDVTYFKRIFSQLSTIKNTEEYVNTITIIRKYYVTLDLWYNIDYLSYVKKYYIALYTKKSGETEDKYYERICSKESFETEEQAAKRAYIVLHFFPNLPLWSSEKYTKYTKFIYTTVYKKQVKEDETTYFKRIVVRVDKETDTYYVARVTLLIKYFKSLTLWYSQKTSTIVKTFYSVKYAKQSGECDADYFKRLVAKEDCDTSDDIYGQRIRIVHEVSVNAPVWYEEKYYETHTKEYYTTYYSKTDCEQDTAYYKRIITRIEKETDTYYVARIVLLKKTFPKIDLWYSKKSFEIVKEVYTLTYAKGAKECDDDYIKRLTAKEVCDSSDEIYAQRIRLVHGVTVSCSGWYAEKYYETYLKNYYSNYYKKGDKEECVAWLTRVISLIPGECEENAIKRITLINKSKSGCKCWTAENIKKLECSFKKEYLDKIRKAFIKTASSLEIKKSSKSSSSKSADSSESSSEVSIKN